MCIPQSKITKSTKTQYLFKKLAYTIIFLFCYQIGNSIPLVGIDQNALDLMISKGTSPLVLNFYFSGNRNTLSIFSLGISPIINASILIDFLTTFIPYLEKLQSEDGQNGKKQLLIYKKLATTLFALIQGLFLIKTVSPYLYQNNFIFIFLIVFQLITGCLITFWFTSQIDRLGLINGISLIIFLNIFTSFVKILVPLKLYSSIFESFILVFFIYLICKLQNLKEVIPIVSAKQLNFLENINIPSFISKAKDVLSIKNDKNGLTLKYNQAGIFPVIIVTNFFPFLSSLTNNLINLNTNFGIFLYYVLLIAFNYFYTIVFWDPEKISEKLRKASISIIGIDPGKKTIKYLELKVLKTSIIGGIFLCILLFCYEICKNCFGHNLLYQINISSLIIVIGISYEFQRKLKFLIYINRKFNF